MSLPFRPSKLLRLGLVTVALVALLVPGAGAARVPDLYAADVPIADQELESRADAYAAALARVLVRASGQRDVASRPEAAALLDQAERFVQQFTYLDGDRMWVAFDGAALEVALNDAGLPVWGSDRPAILVWLVVDRGDGNRRLVGSDDKGAEREVVEYHAAERGLPLIWPLLDSEDLATASAADIWGGFGEKVRQASARYGADAVLVARLRSRVGRGLYGTWDFATGAVSQRFQGNAAEGMNGVADFLVNRLASIGDGGMAVVTITGIDSLGAYSETLGYLERLSLVESVSLIEAGPDVMRFQLAMRGDPARLRRAIGLGKVLAPAPGDDGMSLVFQYLR